MASYNKVLLMGNLTKDPELRYTPQGTAVVNLRLAVNRKYRTKEQELKEEVCFITAVVWNKQAETCNQYLHKGSGVFVEGRLQSRSWEDNTGAKRSVIEVRAERVQFMGAPGQGKVQQGQASQTHAEVLVDEPSSESAWLSEGGDDAQLSEEGIN
ncbi:MAG: single-stranded DNA-binding protein [Candidatus Omnitrophica bacterium]|jgi:single-strand DNA-binding protein|nr:single-stranded DNA-binding protein [Candidatus Omnitrophota bacterium]MDD5690757.1 single-stranded DNA-binding protein [Candidatus Omnitrophota bacterium]